MLMSFIFKITQYETVLYFAIIAFIDLLYLYKIILADNTVKN